MDNALAPLPAAAGAGAPAGSLAAGPTGALAGPLSGFGQLPLAKLPRRSLLLIAGSVIAIVAMAAVLLGSQREVPYKVLFANLSDKDGGAIVAQLSQMNVPYRHTEGGAAIMVPADKVHDVRLRLASQGLPKGGIVGLELMDQTRFGQSQFQERLTFQRGLEGELTRSILSLGSVQGARVHLALPQQHGFYREQQKPSASVLLTLHPGRTLDRSQVAGIVHLVSSSVPEMNPKAVSVLDQNGSLLSGPADGETTRGLDAQQMQYVQTLEQTYVRRVMELLEPVVGKDNLRATVTTEVDFTQSESTSEQFRPNQGDSATAAVRSHQSSESGGQTGVTPPAGVPGAASNQPPTPSTAPVTTSTNGNAGNGAAASTAQSNSRKDQVTNYELDKTVRVTRNATGTIRRVNAAVVLNYRSGVDAKGKPTNSPLSAEELEKFTALVQESVGFNKERGDSVKVINAPFHTEQAPTPVEVPLWSQPEVLELVRTVAAPLAVAIAALALILGVVRPALKPATADVKAVDVAELEPLGPNGTATGGQLQATVDDPLAMPLPAPDGSEALALPAVASLENKTTVMQLEQARQMARENPVAMAKIVSAWVAGEPL